jgi:farnesyl-diphosphate farnesyltransferase
MRLRTTTSEHSGISLLADPVDVLRETSRTFYFPIINLPPGLCEAVMSAYLSLRAIDEIEDHPRLDKRTKIKLLSEISSSCQSLSTSRGSRLSLALEAYRDELPEVSNRLGEWIALAPKPVASHIQFANAATAKRMAYWVGNDWRIRTQADLDYYTFSVAGAVGLLLSDLWTWYDGTLTHKEHAVGFGRGLQSVNILRNRAEDLARGVNFFPDGWNEEDVRSYAKRNLSQADAYVEALPDGYIRDFCRIPLSLAYATLEALGRGEPKLSRMAVLNLVGRASSTPKEDAQGCDHFRRGR